MLTLTVGLSHYLVLAALLFAVGLVGVVMARRNLITVLIAIEVLFLAININFVAFSSYLRDLVGQIFALFILTTAAAEIAIGLAIVVLYYRQHQTLDLDDMRRLRG